jgi:replicative DNA helicase Mcm
VIAAANPKQGSFDRFQPLNEQVEIGSPLLSRFDLIFGVSDRVDPERDTQIATHQHDRVGKDNSKPLDDELITEYIAYARQNVHPSYESEEPKQELVEYYVDKRQESDDEDDTVVPVTPRMNDALRRLAQASARMHLRETITMEDANVAIELMDMTLGDTALEPDGTLNNAKKEGRNQTQEERRTKIPRIVASEKKTIAEITEELGADKSTIENDVEQLLQKGELYEPETNKYLAT